MAFSLEYGSQNCSGESPTRWGIRSIVDSVDSCAPWRQGLGVGGRFDDERAVVRMPRLLSAVAQAGRAGYCYFAGHGAG